jgi:hypothetical protein
MKALGGRRSEWGWTLFLCFIVGPGAVRPESIAPLTRFDARGRLPQSDAAARAVDRGLPVVALTGAECIVLAAPRWGTLSLFEAFQPYLPEMSYMSII